MKTPCPICGHGDYDTTLPCTICGHSEDKQLKTHEHDITVEEWEFIVKRRNAIHNYESLRDDTKLTIKQKKKILPSIRNFLRFKWSVTLDKND